MDNSADINDIIVVNNQKEDEIRGDGDGINGNDIDTKESRDITSGVRFQDVDITTCDSEDQEKAIGGIVTEDTDSKYRKNKKLGVVGKRNGFIIMKVPVSAKPRRNLFGFQKKTFEEQHEEEQKILGKKSLKKLELEGKQGLRRVSGRYRSFKKGRTVGTTHQELVIDAEEDKESNAVQPQQQKHYKHGKKPKQKRKAKKKKKKGKVDPVEEANNNLIDQLMESTVSYDSLNCVRFLGYGRFGAIQLAQEIYEEMPGECDDTNLLVVKKFEVGDKKEDYHELKHTFLRETVLMHKLRDQPHFVNLMAVGKEADSVPLCATFEFMSNGCLKEFLATGFIGIGEKPVLVKDRYKQPRVHPNATNEQLMRIANDVALGMVYLSSLKIIHRDLKAENILLDANLVGKITGFEFAIDEAQDPPIDDFRIEKRSTIRWLSVETLVDGIYNTKSDVWSFGILLWEIITLGGKPYPGVKGTLITKYLELGYRLGRPGDCSTKLYDIMVKCWDATPPSRPSFEELTELLDDILQTPL